MAGHQRSTSWPSTSHPNMTEMQEALQSVSSLISTPPAATIEVVCDGLRRLGHVYSNIDEAICLHGNQLVVSHGKKRLVEEEMERSLQVLDLCSTLQECFGDLKMAVQELQMVLNRGDLPVAQTKAHQSYSRLVKKAKQQLKKSASCKSSSSTSSFSSHDDAAWLVSLLTTARGVTVSALRSAVELLAKEMAICSASRWSLITRSMQKKRVSCEEVRLQALELGIVGLESSVENLFRSLIQTRVSLLNTLSL